MANRKDLKEWGYILPRYFQPRFLCVKCRIRSFHPSFACVGHSLFQIDKTQSSREKAQGGKEATRCQISSRLPISCGDCLPIYACADWVLHRRAINLPWDRSRTRLQHRPDIQLIKDKKSRQQAQTESEREREHQPKISAWWGSILSGHPLQGEALHWIASLPKLILPTSY